MSNDFPLTRLISKSSFTQEPLASCIKELFGSANSQLAPHLQTVLDSKQWENSMAFLTLKEKGALTSESRLVSIGAGLEETLFLFSKYVNLVVATDLYNIDTVWSDVAPAGFIKSPLNYSQIKAHNNILPISSDATDLQLPDGFFDGGFSCGSIEHFGGIANANKALRELSRVLKIGAPASIATEFRIRGPENKNSWGKDTYLFKWDEIFGELIEGTGFELVEVSDKRDIDEETLGTRQNLFDFLNTVKSSLRSDHISEAYPNLVLYHDGFLFSSVHLALIKVKEPSKILASRDSNIGDFLTETKLVESISPMTHGIKQSLISLQAALLFTNRKGFLGMVLRNLGSGMGICIRIYSKLRSTMKS